MQPRTNYLLGVDFGSDSVRCLVVDAADGSELASAVVAYPRWAERLYCDPAHNRYRQHPLDYVESLEASVRQALAACGRDVADAVCGISFDTTASTPALTDAKGTPLALLPEFAEEPDAMFVLWKDHTALAEADEINDLARKWETDYTRYSGGTYSCEWVWAKMLHCLRRSPGLRAAAYSWVEHCDWISALLVGDTTPETIARSRCVAGHKAMWHASWGGLPAPEFLEAVDPLLGIFRGHLYSDTVTGDACVGRLCGEWAARLGLKPGIAVGVGAIDCHVGAVGAHGHGDQLKAHLLGDGKVAVIAGHGAEELAVLDLAPGLRGILETEHHADGDQVVHQLQAGVAAHKDFLRLDAHHVAEQLTGLVQALKVAVVAGIGAGVGGVISHLQQPHCQVHLVRAGLAAGHVQLQVHALKLLVLGLQRGLFSGEFVVIHCKVISHKYDPPK